MTDEEAKNCEEALEELADLITRRSLTPFQAYAVLQNAMGRVIAIIIDATAAKQKQVLDELRDDLKRQLAELRKEMN